MKRVHHIVVFGIELSVRTEADESHVKAISEYLQSKYDEVRSMSQHAPRADLMALAALNVANELFEVQNEVRDLKRALEERSRQIIQKIEQTAVCASGR